MAKKTKKARSPAQKAATARRRRAVRGRVDGEERMSEAEFGSLFSAPAIPVPSLAAPDVRAKAPRRKRTSKAAPPPPPPQTRPRAKSRPGLRQGPHRVLRDGMIIPTPFPGPTPRAGLAAPRFPPFSGPAPRAPKRKKTTAQIDRAKHKETYFGKVETAYDKHRTPVRAVTILAVAVGGVKLNQKYPDGFTPLQLEASTLGALGSALLAFAFRRFGWRRTSSTFVDVGLGFVTGTLASGVGSGKMPMLAKKT